jgi:3',5'-cyclic-AMP phosphodiesterase
MSVSLRQLHNGRRLSGDVIHIVQLSDCHIGVDQDFCLGGVNTYQSFLQVLSEVTGQHSPSMAVISGDIACEGDEASYRLFSEAMESKSLDYTWLPGNHDNFQLMEEVIPQPFCRSVVKGDWVILSLVSSAPGRVGGELSETELQQLSDLLQQHQDQYVLLFVHHPPVEIKCRWLDEQRISNSVQLGKLLAQHNNVKAIFTGHVHQEGMTVWCDTPVYSTPSTCFQFTEGSDTFAISDHPPGYRWIDLYSDGHMETGVEHLDSGAHKVDQSCMGY